MTHTYLENGRVWQASGTYYDESGCAFSLTGETRAKRAAGEWTLSGWMEVASDPPVRFTNQYHIAETASPATLNWESHNPALGTLAGSFELLGSKIISFYTSKDGVFSGAEALIRMDDQTYEAAGAVFRSGARMSSWEVRLTAAP